MPSYIATPRWVATALELRARDSAWSYERIARKLGLKRHKVMFWVNNEYRQRKQLRNRRYHLENKKPHDPARRAAYAEAKETGVPAKQIIERMNRKKFIAIDTTPLVDV